MSDSDSCPSVVRFLLLSTYRCGNHFLRQIVLQHPGVRCLSEIFNVDYKYWEFDKEEKEDPELFKKIVAMHGSEPVRFLETFGFMPKRSTACASGFTIMYDQPEPPHRSQVWSWLGSQSDIRVVHLQRRNELMRFVSYRRAISTGEWVAWKEPNSPGAIRIDPEEFLADLAETARLRTDALESLAAHPVLTIDYEDVVDDSRAQVRRVFEFLGMEEADTQPITFKQGITDIRDAIANFPEVRQSLEGRIPVEWLDPPG